jgi:hypothetical protein
MTQYDFNANKHTYYGHYCNKARDLNMTRIPYNQFTYDFWNDFRKTKPKGGPHV